MTDPHVTVMIWVWGSQAFLFSGLALLCAFWMFRLWRRTGESIHFWFCGIFFCRFLTMLNNAVQTVSVNIPGLNEYPYANLTSAAHRFAQFLFPLAEYFCIFAALASFAGKTVLFSKFGGRVRDRFLKFIEPLRVKMP